MERLDRFEGIGDNIEDDSPPPAVNEELRAELNRRLNDYLAAPDNVTPWEEVKATYESRG
ncbi:MAG: addiction module protein [Pirellulales bacterium]